MTAPLKSVSPDELSKAIEEAISSLTEEKVSVNVGRMEWNEMTSSVEVKFAAHIKSGRLLGEV